MQGGNDLQGIVQYISGKGEKSPKRNAVREIEAILIMHKLLRSEAPSSKAIVIRPRSLCFLGHLPLAGFSFLRFCCVHASSIIALH